MTFAKRAKDLRIQKGYTLRQFCELLGLDPSNWSKIERGINLPPDDPQLLTRLADFFNLEGESKALFFDEAALGRREIPTDIANDERLIAALPAFFRAARSHNLTPETLESFYKDIERLHSPD